jgi:hypothetical protein
MGEKFLFKIHKSYRWIVAVCDEEIYGKKFTEGIKQIDLTGNFFKGDLIDRVKLKSEILRCIREDATFNIVGARAVEIAKELGMARDENTLKINDIPFVLVLL